MMVYFGLLLKITIAGSLDHLVKIVGLGSLRQYVKIQSDDSLNVHVKIVNNGSLFVLVKINQVGSLRQNEKIWASGSLLTLVKISATGSLRTIVKNHRRWFTPVNFQLVQNSICCSFGILLIFVCNQGTNYTLFRHQKTPFPTTYRRHLFDD